MANKYSSSEVYLNRILQQPLLISMLVTVMGYWVSVAEIVVTSICSDQ